MNTTDNFSGFNGLSSREVDERISQGKVNRDEGIKTKSAGRIIFDHIFNLFNLMNIALALAVVFSGSPKNALFICVVLANTIIGTFQELRAKQVTDRLTILAMAKVRVIRDGVEKRLNPNEIVSDDLMKLQSGEQLSVDAMLVDGECEVNEALLSGESEPVIKRRGDKLLSGSVLVSGECLAVVTAINRESYAAKITDGARYIKKPNSEIMRSINLIIKISCFCIPFIGAALFIKQYFYGGRSLADTVISTVASVSGMLPTGLVLLSSLVFCAGVVRLSQINTLVQQLYCIETLARVDVLCLDKTGTITEGRMKVNDVINISNSNIDITLLLAEFGALSRDENPTINALRDSFPPENGKSYADGARVAFSSSRKWSAAECGIGSAFLGACEIISPKTAERYSDLIKSRSEGGERVLLFALSLGSLEGQTIPDDLTPLALIFLSDTIRGEAPDTLRYFKQNNVSIKVISGDNPRTVESIAVTAGLESTGCRDMSRQENSQIDDKLCCSSVFGRVNPDQKLAIIKKLKENHTVAMTGDGVNDVLALREADCSIAIASGSDAARNVSQLVLLDSDFSCLPKIVAEGRRAVNNIERSATLFLTKTVYTLLLSFILIFAADYYPFQPIHMTLISAFTIGIPGCILGIEPNTEIIRGSFLKNVMRRSLPASLAVLFNILASFAIASLLSYSDSELSTLAVLATGGAGLVMLFYTSFPFTKIRIALLALMSAGFYGATVIMPSFFSLEIPSAQMRLILVALAAFTFALLYLLKLLFRKIIK